MIHKLTLEHGMLTVTVLKPAPDKGYLDCVGNANCSMPPWTTRAALLAILDAAITEAEAQADHQVEQVRKAAP